MLRLLILAVVAGSFPLQDAKRPPIDRDLVRKFQELTPEQKERLRRRVEALREIVPGERRRLQENLERFRAMAPDRQKAVRDRLEKMTPEERRSANEFAHGFFRRMNARYGAVRFPRGAFFRWAATRRAEAYEAARELEEGPRADALLKLAHEYRGVLHAQIRQHARRHACVKEGEVQALGDLTFGDFWGEAEALRKKCPNAAPPPAPRKP